MPHNLLTQTQSPGKRNFNLPGFNAASQSYQITWAHLKPPGCEETTAAGCNPNPLQPAGALEDQNQKLFYETRYECHGNLSNDLLADPVNLDNPANEVLFPKKDSGIRPCNGFNIRRDENGNPIVDENGLAIPYSTRFNPVVLSKIELPNGQFYEFKYNRYGEISKIIYPTGGYETFIYGKITPLSINSTVFDQTNRGVIQREVHQVDQTLVQKWTYQAAFSYAPNGNSSYVVTTIAPRADGTPGNGVKTERFLYTDIYGGGNFGFSDPRAGMIKEERTYSENNGSLHSRTLTEWITTGSPSTTARDARPLRTVAVVIEGNQALATLTETKYENPDEVSSTAPADPNYFARLNVKQTKSYNFKVIDLSTAQNGTFNQITDYFNGATPAAINESDYLYSASYKDRGITSLPIATRILDPANLNQILYKSQTIYDEGGNFTIADQGTTVGYQVLTETNANLRGNATTTQIWNNENQLWITRHAQYDNFGNVIKIWDALGRTSEVEFSSQYYYAYPTKTISPVPGGNGAAQPLTALTVYDFKTGLPTSVTDSNGQTTQMEYNDPLLRPTRIIAPNGQQIITEYGAGTDGATRYVKTKMQIDETKWKESYAWNDGLGKMTKIQKVDASGDIFVEIEYDRLGRVKKTTNPHRTGETVYWTENSYDELNRIVKVKTPDAAEILTNYSLATTGANIGAAVTITDQALKQRRSIANALGQIIRADEPTDAAALGAIDNPNQPTYYEYDGLGNLTKIKQGGTFSAPVQTRNFVYDSLSQVTSATNPESGLIQYRYDDNGNLTKKIDGRNVETNYAYDALNRIISRSYTAPANLANYEASLPISYYYDNLPNAKGKLTKVVTGVPANPFSTTEYQTFDAMGRVTQSQQKTDGTNPNPMTYTYNLSGALVEQGYPSGRVVKNTLDANGDLAIVESAKTLVGSYKVYANQFIYTAAGAVSSMRLGNGNFETRQFNSRLQPVQIGLGTAAGTQNLLKLNFNYGTTDNNGNIKQQTITVPTEIRGNTTYSGFVATQNYTYDSLNRLYQAGEAVTPNGQPLYNSWTQTFQYDRYGNRRFNETYTTTLPKNCIDGSNNPTVCAMDQAAVNPLIDNSNNRLQGYLYDAAGNTKQDANGRRLTYDAENKQTKVETLDVNNNVIVTNGIYFYDGDGKRIKKIVPATGETTIFIYDAAGKMVAEYSTQINANPQVGYLTSDHLGSPRINTNASGAVTARHDYQPFGEEILRTGYAVDTVKQKFTSYKRDNESDLDFAQARMYNNKLGRFISPDPLLSTGQPDSPQTWNKFSYVVNNPIILTDPTGMYLCTAGKTNCDKFEANLQERINNLDKIMEIYGENSSEYIQARDAVDVYGKKDEDNGVIIGLAKDKDLPKRVAGRTDVAGIRQKKTTLNPEGQLIKITISQKAFDSNSLGDTIVHEGSHAADGSEWIKCGFYLSKNPTIYQTEFKAYLVEAIFSQAREEQNWINYTPVLKKGEKAFGVFQVWTPSWKSVDEAKSEINFFLKHEKLYKDDLTEKSFVKGGRF